MLGTVRPAGFSIQRLPSLFEVRFSPRDCPSQDTRLVRARSAQEAAQTVWQDVEGGDVTACRRVGLVDRETIKRLAIALVTAAAVFLAGYLIGATWGAA